MTQQTSSWAAVWAIGLGVASLSTAELMPVSLLTVMADDLQITEGLAGQTVTAPAIAAIVTGLIIGPLARHLDRRWLLLSLSLLQAVSNGAAAATESFPLLLAARVVLGVSIGGFWSMASALAMRLVPLPEVPKAFSVVFGGGSVATVLIIPISAWAGSVIGWRGVFVGAAAFSLLAFVAQLLTVPSIPVTSRARLGDLVPLIRRPAVSWGMVACIPIFGGRQMVLTYLRPFLEQVAHVSAAGVSAALSTLGIGVLAGNILVAARVVRRGLHRSMAVAPLVMAGIATTLTLLGRWSVVVFAGLVIWGVANAVTTVGWNTWITRVAPDRAETMGGLLVAAIQISIMIGAAAGGVAIDTLGPLGPVGAGATVMLAGSVVTLLRLPATREPAVPSA